MRKFIKILPIIIISFVLFSQVSYADKWKGALRKSSQTTKAAVCIPATGSSDLDINNVRTRINTGGDMWWDFEVSRYEVPKGSRKTSMFSASLWIGGRDVNDQLKLAALRYRQIGNDYWTGPLTIDGTASIDGETCKRYDKHWKISRTDVEKFIAYKAGLLNDPEYSIPTVIKEWPAHPIDGNPKQAYYLAPFADVDGDGNYNWENGDYPYYDFANDLCPRNHVSAAPMPTMGTIAGSEKGGLLVDQVLKGDMTLWWVFNDKGAAHTETQGEPIGLEIRAQAFAFATNDEINNMTFYSYEIINRSTFTLTDTYFSQWVDTDLGDATDDYVGCDVRRGLGYCYNGDEVDGTGKYNEYGAQPPAIGVDFFQGPYMDPDGYDNPSFLGTGVLGPTIPNTIITNPAAIVSMDKTLQTFSYNDTAGNLVTKQVMVNAEAINGVNFGDGIVDNERFGMRRFVFHNNSGGNEAQTDPDFAIEYYNLLKGIWKDNSPMCWGKNAHRSSGGNPNIPCAFMFPGDTDPWNWGTFGVIPPAIPVWIEANVPNQPADRRFMQSAGPFILKPGAVNYITVGIPWARAGSGGALQSVTLLQKVDDKCQTLFDNCFKVLDGPDAPELTHQELDKEVILYLKNIGGNNVNESYTELDPTIPAQEITTKETYNLDTATGQYNRVITVDTVKYERYYKFEGYQIFQLKNASVSIADIYNTDLSRLVFQCDKKNFDKDKNAIGKLINYNYSDDLNGNVPQEMVNGGNVGVTHSVKITEDKFATGDKRLVNNKKYYYIAIAYAYNNFLQYSQDPNDQNGAKGQKKPYLAGRKSSAGSIELKTVIPHNPIVENSGTVLNAVYGSRPEITRIEGNGNGGLAIDLKQTSIDKIMAGSPWTVAEAEYKVNRSPLNVKVIDPLNVKAGEFFLKFIPKAGATEVDTSFTWQIYSDILTNPINSDATIALGDEQLLTDLGLSVQILNYSNDYLYPQALEGSTPTDGAKRIVQTEVLESSMTFADPSNPWLLAIPDVDGTSSYNWIRSGQVSFGDTPTPDEQKLEDYHVPENGGNSKFWYDAAEKYEKVVNGTWAPFALTGRWTNNPGFDDEIGYNRNLKHLYSVDIVLTPDKNKWTRCVVLETCDDIALSEGGRRKLDPRKSPSVNKEGQPDGSGEGMGWFPGYAINVETGERLNIMFGEDSWLVNDNGRDMLFNPTSNYTTNLGNIIWGGKHFVYIMSHQNNIDNVSSAFDCPSYDEGAWLNGKFTEYLAMSYNPLAKNKKTQIFQNAMWVNIPMAAPSTKWLANECKISIRVARPYKRYYSTFGVGSSTPINDNWPLYKFNTNSVATGKNDNEVAKSALDLINVVPNPYYGFSFYETNQLDNRIKIVNLPDKCVISIYSLNGTLVRQFKKDDNAQTFVEWDLKNHANIPISGGVYIIHVNADGIGEKTIKWFGALRPTDLNSF